MQKKLESKTAFHNFISTGKLLVLIVALALPTLASAQSEEMKQKISAFKSDQEVTYEMKYLNIADRNLGGIDETGYEWKDEFMLKTKERVETNLGRKSHLKFYFSIYGYETLTDRQYALKDWMDSFIEGETMRAGRDKRTFNYGKPTLILINDTEIIICNYDCSDYTEDNFEKWEDDLLRYFGHDNTIVIEIYCDGPLKWTKNAPDPKTRGLF